MGLTSEIARFLVQGVRSGAPFKSVLTLGHQYGNLAPENLKQLLADAGCWPPKTDEATIERLMAKPETRFEGLARALGATQVVACDASAYEGADFTHDLNIPVSEAMQEQFDAVIDSGTLEHVFNFPVAIASCMRMVKTGGALFLFTPANNYFGHGFYQFSPELFYRVLSEDNGFHIEQMWAKANAEGVSSLLGVEYPFPISTPAYSVKDPAEIHQRVTLINAVPTLLFIRARKTASVPLFQRPPQQSDYARQWQGAAEDGHIPPPPRGSQVIAFLKSKLPEWLWRNHLPTAASFFDPFRLARFRRANSLKNKAFFKRIDG